MVFGAIASSSAQRKFGRLIYVNKSVSFQDAEGMQGACEPM